MHILSASLNVPKSISALFFSFSFLISAVFLVFLASGLYVGSTFSLKYGHKIITSIDYMYRCTLYPEMSDYIPFLNMVSRYWEKSTCWANSLGLFNRLLSAKYLTRSAKLCINGGSLLNVIEKVVFGLGALFDQTVTWIGNNPFLYTYPIYPALTLLSPISTEASKFLQCECELLGPFYKVLLEPYHNNTLPCGVHQIVNGALGFVQVTGRYVVDVFIQVTTLVQQGNIYEILKVFYGNTPTNEFYFYLLHAPFERIASGVDYLGEWLDVAFKNAVCVIVSEAKAGSISDAAVDAEYAQCRITTEPIKIFCIISKLAITLIRTSRIVLEMILYFVRFVNPFDDFRQTLWNPNIIWDSLRNPLPYMNSSSIQNIPTSNISTCNETFPFTNMTLSCTECTLLSTTSFEDCFCSGFVNQIDNLVEGSINIRIFKPILCDLLFGVVRVAISIGKFATDNIRFFPFETVPYLSKYDTYDAILDELGGPSYRFNSGVLYSPISLIEALLPQYPSLRVLPSIIVYPLKFLTESVRFGTHLFANICKDFLQLPSPFTYGQFTTNYLCVDRTIGSYCLNMEDAAQWLRIPRNMSLFYNDFVPYNSTAGSATFEFVCDIFNLSFLDSLNIPELTGFDIPDLCCFIYNFGRSVIEIYRFIMELLIAFIQTVVELTSYGNPYNRIFVLDFISCLNSNSTAPCSNINCILNDLTNILGCGCLTIEDIENIPGVSGTVSTAPLTCLCTAFTGATSVVANVFIEFRNTAQLLFGVFTCIDTLTGQFRNTTECRTTLPDKMANLFTRIDTIFGLIGITAENLVCALGSLLSYDCVNSIAAICIEIDFDNCVRRQCNTFNPVNPITNNGFPSPAQFADCINQCGSSFCTACNETITATLAFFGGSATTNCPNPCVSYPCQPRDRLKVLASRLWAFFEGYIKIFTNLLADIFLYGINQAGGNAPNAPTAFPISLSAYVDLFLTATGNGLFGSAIDNTWGIMQALGDALNCLIGPAGCTDTSLTGGFPCFGNLFLIVGNLLQQVYPGIVNIVTDIVNIIELLLSPGSGDLGEAIKALIFDIFDFVFVQLLGNLTIVLDALGSFLAAVISWVVTFGNPDVLYPALKIFIDAILFIVDGLVKTITTILKVFGVKLKRGVVANTLQNFQTEYNLTDAQMELIQDPTLLLGQITPGTYCYRVISELANKTSYADMALFEELAFRFCYNMVLLPIINNANPGKTITMPVDLTYNTDTMLGVLGNGIQTLNAYAAWNTPSSHVYSLLSWSSTQKRGTEELINTMEYGSNFSQFLVDQNLLDPNKTEHNMVHQLITYGETNATDQRVQGTMNYADKVQNYLTNNPTHMQNYATNGTMERFTLYYSSYMSLLRAHVTRNAEKRNLRGKLRPQNMEKKVTTDHVFSCIVDTFKKTIPQVVGGSVFSQKRTLKLDQDPINILYFAFNQVYIERMRLIMDVVGYVSQKQVKYFTETVTQFGENLSAQFRTGQSASGRLSVLDRISILHKQLTRIPALKSVIPELPPAVHDLTHSIGQQRLVTVNCSCNCSIVENFLQEAVDIWTYCYETQVLGNNVSFVTYRGPLIELVPYNASQVSDNFVENWIGEWSGISLPDTIISFFEQTNRKKHLGPVGFLYVAEPIIPFVSRPCERVNLTCELGVGLETAFLYVMLIFILYVLIIYAWLPPISSFVQVVILGLIFGGSVSAALSTTMANWAWGYEAKCYIAQDNTLLSWGLGISFLPLLPQCAVPQINQLIQKYIITATPLASFGALGLLDMLNYPSQETYLQPGGYPCPNKVEVQSCYDYGVTSIWVIFGMTLTRYLPSVATWLKYSCLVRGGCGHFLLLSTPDPMLTNDGWLAGLFESYNGTAFLENTDKKLNFCYWWHIWTLAVLVIIIYVASPILSAVAGLGFDIVKLIVLSLATMLANCKYEEDAYLERETAKLFGNF